MGCLPLTDRRMWNAAMWVVKLGGSLHGSPALRRWLTDLACSPGPPRVVVPGGGPFADAVRSLQPVLKVDDLAAHRMAILAMQQFGIALQALEPRLALAETEAELRSSQAAVWLPWCLVGLEPRIEASWTVTSDSLACWLATRLRATDLVLVKSAPLDDPTGDVAVWTRAGLVDADFPRFARRFAGRIRLLHRDAPLALPE
jgi:aspartokinase-like uncharacterized kinase